MWFEQVVNVVRTKKIMHRGKLPTVLPQLSTISYDHLLILVLIAVSAEDDHAEAFLFDRRFLSNLLKKITSQTNITLTSGIA